MLYQKIVYSTYIACQFLTPRTVDASAYTVASAVQSAATTMMVMAAVQSPDKTVVDAGALLSPCTGTYGDAITACQRFTVSTNSQDADLKYCDVDDIHYQNAKWDEDTCWCSDTATCSDDPFAEVWFAGDWYDITQVGVQACRWNKEEYVTKYKVGYHDGSAWTFVGGSTLSSATLYDVSGQISCGKDSCTNPPAKSIGSVSCKGIRLYPREASTHCSTNMEIYGLQGAPPTTKSPTQKPTTKSPTKKPTTKSPTKNPTNVPTTKNPTKNPTKVPTKVPTSNPTQQPTKVPTRTPTKTPSKSPTPPPTPPGTLLCGAPTTTGDYNGGPLSFSVLIPFDGDLTFDVTSSPLGVASLANFRNLNPGVLDNGLGDADAAAGVIKLENLAAGTYQFTLEFGANGEFAVDTRCTSDAPTKAPTDDPTKTPTDTPTKAPTPGPTANPTDQPTRAPNMDPTLAPTPAPTGVPTKGPTAQPSDAPTGNPTDQPTETPTEVPTDKPTPDPTVEDSAEVDEDDQGEDDNGAREIVEEPTDPDVKEGLLGLGLTGMEWLVVGATALLVCTCCAIGLCILTRVRKFKEKQEHLVGNLSGDQEGDELSINSGRSGAAHNVL